MMRDVCKTIQKIANSNYKNFFIVIVVACFLNILASALLALPWGNLISASCRWDCFWYSDVATNGYSRIPLLYDVRRPAQAAWAFFPLYPLISSTISHFFAINVQSAGFLVNIILWPFVIFLCYRDLELRNIYTNRLFFLLFFIFYPFNIWYTAQYSEAIYGLLLMTAIVTLRSGQVELAALICAFLSIARPTGIIMTICLSAWWLLSNPKNTRICTNRPLQHRISDSLLLIAAGGAGLSLFVLYLFHLTGDGFAFTHVEIAWHKKFRFFLFHILHALSHKHEIFSGIFAILSLLLIGKMFSRTWALNVFLVGSTALLASSTGTQSIERYVFGNPLTIQFLACSTLSRSQRFIWITIIAMAILHLATTILWYYESNLVI